jgi:hypothetical protein
MGPIIKSYDPISRFLIIYDDPFCQVPLCSIHSGSSLNTSRANFFKFSACGRHLDTYAQNALDIDLGSAGTKIRKFKILHAYLVAQGSTPTLISQALSVRF